MPPKPGPPLFALWAFFFLLLVACAVYTAWMWQMAAISLSILGVPAFFAMACQRTKRHQLSSENFKKRLRQLAIFVLLELAFAILTYRYIG